MSNLVTLKKDIADTVAERVRKLQESKKLHLPADYSAENALKSAWLILQNAYTKDRKPVLDACTKGSIINSLFDMVVQGLNPAKKQGYFITYGNQLVFQRSYFGTMALAKRVDPTIREIIVEVVYEGDTFKYRIIRGKKEITDHEQSLENIGKPIKAAYCLIINVDDEVVKTEIMTMDEIKQAWKQSQTSPVDESGRIKANTMHDKFTAEMAKKTVINRACKAIINSSSDSCLFLSANRADEIRAEQDIEQEIAENTNQEIIDIEEPETQTAIEETVKPDPPKQEVFKKTVNSKQQNFNEGPGF